MEVCRCITSRLLRSRKSFFCSGLCLLQASTLNPICPVGSFSPAPVGRSMLLLLIFHLSSQQRVTSLPNHMNVILLFILPSTTDGKNLELHLGHLAGMIHHEACIPAHSPAPSASGWSQCIRLVRRIAISRDFIQWLETNSDATQLQRRGAVNLRKIKGSQEIS